MEDSKPADHVSQQSSAAVQSGLTKRLTAARGLILGDSLTMHFCLSVLILASRFSAWLSICNEIKQTADWHSCRSNRQRLFLLTSLDEFRHSAGIQQKLPVVSAAFPSIKRRLTLATSLLGGISGYRNGELVV